MGGSLAPATNNGHSMNTLSMPDITKVTQPICDLFGELVREVGNLDSAATTPYNIRYYISLLEHHLKALFKVNSCITQEDFPLKHIFTEGVYAREISIPVGMLVIGKIHRHEHLNFISKGSVTVVTESGGVEHLNAPCTMISPVGTKRVLITHEDTVWTTVHLNPTEERDIDKIVAEISVESYQEVGFDDPIVLMIQ